MKYLRKQKSTIPTLTDEDGTVANTNSEKAEMLNSFFAKCFNTRSAPLEENRDTPQLKEILEDLHYTEGKICKLLGHLDTSKSNRPDGIFLQEC